MSHGPVAPALGYTAGLDRIEEAVISAHCMQGLARDGRLALYDDDRFTASALTITAEAVEQTLIPALLRACEAFSRERAEAATARAREQYRAYGLGDPREVGPAQVVTEVLFDRQYQRGTRQTCSRELLCRTVAAHVDADRPIRMVIPALPFKFSSPLRTRGRLPDLAELNFLLELYEIAATVELVYRAARPGLTGRLAGFTVVSDGSRFNRIVHEPDSAVDRYRAGLQRWVRRLGLDQYITLVDYRSLLREALPPAAREVKAAIAADARIEYAKVLWPVLDPYEPATMLRTAAAVEPDPEYANPEGRFVSLLKSLVFTVHYRTLDRVPRLSAPAYRALYRELTAHLFEPYAVLSPAELAEAGAALATAARFAPTDATREYLRQAMLREAWATAIDYLAEIKSDRELAEDPILTCLPGQVRWTIHAKPGQLAIATATANGLRVQAWAGVAVFKLTKRKEIKLCTLPVLAVEGAGAVPVRVAGAEQPLFYLHPDLPHADAAAFLGALGGSLARRRVS
ncbi:L-tyrosine/L-tryptophan isonitrile synthase family protein [Actinoplanes sp. NPDC049599]|uniref:L-tyrosine/L-tryptophan isonitrile synthase family protein n=1 Tax=Actinoplanes sp. NPDC049599 TaxID=3363903 RepID=UPI003788576B